MTSHKQSLDVHKHPGVSLFVCTLEKKLFYLAVAHGLLDAVAEVAFRIVPSHEFSVERSAALHLIITQHFVQTFHHGTIQCATVT